MRFWKYFSIFLVSILIGTSVVLFIRFQKQDSVRVIDLNGKRLTLEIVREAGALQRGLSGRVSLAPDHGMLFVFDHPEKYKFWMKDMRFSIDIVYLRNGRVIDIFSHVPMFDEHGAVTSVQPKEPADNVLELVAGQASEYGLIVGVEFSGR